MSQHDLKAGITRRQWLQLLALSSTGGSLLSTASPALAATTDYRALVCIQLQGGNDGFNTLLSLDAGNWAAYQTTRRSGLALPEPGTAAQPRASQLALRMGGVLPIEARSSRTALALHPALRRTQGLFSSGRLSFVANVGPLLSPTTKDAVQGDGVALPPKLYSHNDQAAVWQSMGAEGAQAGWGGRFADDQLSRNRETLLSAISLQGQSLWLTGESARSYGMSTTGAVRVNGGREKLFGSALAQRTLLDLMSGENAGATGALARLHTDVASRSQRLQSTLAAALPAATVAPWGTPGTPSGRVDPMLVYMDPVTGVTALNPLALQLQAVARTIAARGALGIQRQLFHVTLGTFDTHDDQIQRQTTLLAQLDHALGYFADVLTRMGLPDAVTTFTSSEFGRTLASNGDGSDHGWGNHHLVMGPAVQGGELYGRMPALVVADSKGNCDSEDQLSGGALLPSTSLQAYASTLGTWFGVSNATLDVIFPERLQWSATDRRLRLAS